MSGNTKYVPFHPRQNRLRKDHLAPRCGAEVAEFERDAHRGWDDVENVP